MKKYRFSGRLDKLLHQNDAEILECADGYLLDNLLIRTKRGYIALIETYVNCWTSNYTLYFSCDYEPILAVFERGIS